MLRTFFLTFLLTLFYINCFCQSDEIKIANQYYNNEEYDKALPLYQKISRNTGDMAIVYNNHLSTLLTLKNFSDAEKLIKKIIKAYPDNIYYKADEYLLVLSQKGEEKSDKEFQTFVKEVKSNPELSTKTA